jgi:molybdate transport system regulatory protein
LDSRTTASARLFIRINLASQIGPGQIALLEAIREHRSITEAARSLGISYRGAWLSLQKINQAMREPAVTTEAGGNNRGGTTVTPAGDRIVGLYRSIEAQTREAAAEELHAIQRLARRGKKPAPAASAWQRGYWDRLDC